MKFFVAYVVDFKPYFWNDVNSQMVSDKRVRSGECEPMCYPTYAQAMKVMCSIRSRKAFYVEGCFAVLDENSLTGPNMIVYQESMRQDHTRKSVEDQLDSVKKRPSRKLPKPKAKKAPVEFVIRYDLLNGASFWLGANADWVNKADMAKGCGVRTFQTYALAENKVKELRAITRAGAINGIMKVEISEGKS